MIDLYKSRRSNYIKCEWYAQNEDEEYVSLDQIKHFSFPAGAFYAKELNSYSVENQVSGNVFMADAHNVSLQTTDNVKALRNNDYVVFDGKLWRVDNKTTTPNNSQRQFRNREHISATTIISLRR